MWPSMRFADSWATQPTPDTISTYTYAYSTKPLSEISSSIDKRLRAYIDDYYVRA